VLDHWLRPSSLRSAFNSRKASDPNDYLELVLRWHGIPSAFQNRSSVRYRDPRVRSSRQKRMTGRVLDNRANRH